jgi:translation elongation factor EF-4
MKLWTKQKIGKKRMKKLGKVNIESSNIKNILQNNKY